MRNKILAIDDDELFLSGLELTLAKDHELVKVTDIPGAIQAMLSSKFDLVLLDMNIPEVSGLEFLKILRQRHRQLPVIMLTGDSKPDSIIAAMKAGADDYVIKGTEDFMAGLKLRIHQVLELKGIKQQNKLLSKKIKESAGRYELLGISTETIRLRAEITKFKGTSAYVLIMGENGTGKELVARTLNLQENDPSRPFIAVNCAAIPSDLFESELFGHVKGSFTGANQNKEGKFLVANGGDIFLDEIGELSLEMQVKLLRVLQEKVITPVGSNKQIPISVRVISATNKKLEDLVREGKFRKDLYFRLNQIVLQTTSLAQRKEDVLFLAKTFAERIMPGVSLTKEACKLLENHSWPGNIRELQNIIERACILARSNQKTRILPEYLHLSDLRENIGMSKIPPGVLPFHIGDLTPEKFKSSLEWMEKVFLNKGLDLLMGDNNALILRLGFSKSHYYRRKKALNQFEEKSNYLN